MASIPFDRSEHVSLSWAVIEERLGVPVVVPALPGINVVPRMLVDGFVLLCHVIDGEGELVANWSLSASTTGSADPVAEPPRPEHAAQGVRTVNGSTDRTAICSAGNLSVDELTELVRSAIPAPRTTIAHRVRVLSHRQLA